MILEMPVLRLKPGRADEFRDAFGPFRHPGRHAPDR
jgi:hypothetical protein